MAHGTVHVQVDETGQEEQPAAIDHPADIPRRIGGWSPWTQADDAAVFGQQPAGLPVIDRGEKMTVVNKEAVGVHLIFLRTALY